jgi:hypothetical protein
MGSGTKSPQTSVPAPLQTAPLPASSSAFTKSWLRFAFPSLPDLIFVALLVCFALGPLSQKLLSDGDIGWHIRNGQQILISHSLPRTDSFSSTMSGRPWFAWEWLYDAGIGAIYNIVGLNGVVAASALIIALTFLIAFRVMVRDGANYVLALITLLLAVSASMIHALARPHLISWLFVVIWFAILEREENRQQDPSTPSRLYWLPVLMLLWVNLHGGFLLGFVLLAAYLLEAVATFFRTASSSRGQALSRTKSLAEVTALSAVASLVNPYGYRLYLHIYQYLSNRFLMTHINEFKSPDFHGVAERCFLLLLVIAVLAAASAWRNGSLSHWFLLLFAASAGLRASRNLPVAALLLAMIAAPYLSDLLLRLSRSESSSVIRAFAARLQAFSAKMSHTQAALRGPLWPILATFAVLWACLHNGALGPYRAMDAHFDPKHFPVNAVDRLAAERTTEPIFTQDSWGGYLIYRLYPQTKVVVDDRHDLYGEQFLQEYLKALHVESGWQSVLDGWNVNLVVMPQNSKLAAALQKDSRWRVIETDDVATTFQRLTSQP